jgi:tetratricopeptide (TPR) repeat protein
MNRSHLLATFLFAMFVFTLASPAWAQEATYAAGSEAYTVAAKLYSARKYKEAGVAYEAFLAKFAGHPNRSQAFYNAVSSYRNAKDTDGALRVAASFEKAFGSTMQVQTALNSVAYVLYSKKRYDEALVIWRKLFDDASYSGRSSVWGNMYNCYSRQKKYEECVKLADSILAKYKGPKAHIANVLRNKQRALVSLKKYDEIPAVVEAIDKLLPNSAYAGQAWKDLGYVYYSRARDDAKAYEAYHRGATIVSYSDAEGCMSMAINALRRMKPVDGAKLMAAYEEFFKLFPESGNTIRLKYEMAYNTGVLLKDSGKEYDLLQIARKSAKGTAYMEPILDRLVVLGQKNIGDPAVGPKAAQELLKLFPKSAKSERALYWLAELDLKSEAEGAKTEGKKKLEQLIKQYPAGSYVERAKKALAKL